MLTITLLTIATLNVTVLMSAEVRYQSFISTAISWHYFKYSRLKFNFSVYYQKINGSGVF